MLPIAPAPPAGRPQATPQFVRQHLPGDAGEDDGPEGGRPEPRGRSPQGLGGSVVSSEATEVHHSSLTNGFQPQINHAAARLGMTLLSGNAISQGRYRGATASRGECPRA